MKVNSITSRNPNRRKLAPEQECLPLAIIPTFAIQQAEKVANPNGHLIHTWNLWQTCDFCIVDILA
ncbi:MAG: hypothetical protein JWR26_2013 [Pedosphaera sp.]|nr:hypothetical protein [Pedosphaera sp.]